MFGRHHQLKTLTARKRLLVAESELNRAQLAGDVRTLTAGVLGLTRRTTAFSSIVGSAAALAATAVSFAPGKLAAPSRMQTLLKGAGFAASLWLAYLTRRRTAAKLNSGTHPPHTPPARRP